VELAIPAINHIAKTEEPYEPPKLVELGGLHALTLGCDKALGSSDGFTFMGQTIVCSSATR
jgi:hypothetical protein